MVLVSDYIGVVGVGVTLIAYILLHEDKIASNSAMYAGMNAIGSLLILYSLYYDWNLAAFVMECCWFLVSLYGIYKYYYILKR